MVKNELASGMSSASTGDAEQAIEWFQKEMLDTIRATPAGDALVAYERYSAFLPAAGVPVGALHYSDGGNKSHTSRAPKDLSLPTWREILAELNAQATAAGGRFI